MPYINEVLTTAEVKNMRANTSPTKIVERSVDDARSLRVRVAGAGVSGLIAAIKLQELVQHVNIEIIEKNSDLGGTWFENRYPGCACDIPAHSYQLSWESNVAWSQYYASQSEILKYWKRVAEKYDVRKLMKFSQRVLEARWHPLEDEWEIKVEDVSKGEIRTERCDVFITALGVLNQWEWPSIPGLHSFEGKLMHSAAWDEGFDTEGKRIAVIGAGSSGIQIVPSIQPHAARIDHYVRGKTWIATTIAGQELRKRGVKEGNFAYEIEEIEAWKSDPELYLLYRRQVEEMVQGDYAMTLRGSELHKMLRGYFVSLMTKRLAKKPEILEHMLPDFSPCCKRLTPGPGYLEALTEPNVNVIPTPIKQITETGILSTDGQHRDVDAIVCATGFNTHYTRRFPIYGLDDEVLFERKNGPKTSTYLSAMLDTHPNLFMLLGPNAGVGAGNQLMIIERLVEYCGKLLAKMQTQNISSIRPKKKKVDQFTEYADQYFERTVFSEQCSSWYKTDGRVSALWPGSSLHAIKVLENPRWEDFEYTYGDDNAMGWIGNGSTVADNNSRADKAYYITSSTLVADDLPLYPKKESRNGCDRCA